jgi:6-phosphogluconolactonase
MSGRERQEREVRVFEDLNALSRAAAAAFAEIASARTGDRFTVALTGGSSPKQTYLLLSEPPLRDSLPWDRTHLFFGDDRCVPPDSPDSNYGMAHETLLSRLEGVGGIYRIEGELPDHDEAARRYEAEIARAFALSPGELPRFDLVLLGMGPDGHCASLFPHKPALNITDRLTVATPPGLKPFVDRVTLTFPVLDNAANVIFLVAGAEKADALQRVLNGPPDPDGLPSQRIRPTDGQLLWLVDRAAAGSGG